MVIKLHKKPEISYDDGLTCKNYFTQITIDIGTKEVKRDNIETSLKEEFYYDDAQINNDDECKDIKVLNYKDLGKIDIPVTE